MRAGNQQQQTQPDNRYHNDSFHIIHFRLEDRLSQYITSKVLLFKTSQTFGRDLG
jgi:hypothetical protein